IQALYVGNFVGERLASQGALAALLAGRLGLGGIPATKVEGACASGGIALRHGVLAIALGLYDFVLVAGAEKMTASPTPEVTAALVLCPADRGRDFHRAPVRVLGSGHATGPATLWETTDLTSFPATVRAAREAYAMARVTPAEVQVAEVHDCFTIAEIIATEDLGFVPKGKGGPAVEEGWTGLDGRAAVNPSGGL